MPLPQRRKNESRGEFLTRCYTDSKMEQEYPLNKQRMAVCLNLANRIESTDVGVRGGEKKRFNESITDYPKGISEAAERGIRLNEDNGNKCATQVGKVRAQQLAQGKPISIETIKRMYSYLSRAQEYYNPNDTTACGTISYLLWGGEPALSWSKRFVEGLEE